MGALCCIEEGTNGKSLFDTFKQNVIAKISFTRTDGARRLRFRKSAEQAAEGESSRELGLPATVPNDENVLTEKESGGTSKRKKINRRKSTGMLGQVSGHAGNFVRVSDTTVCKAVDEAEVEAYEKLTKDIWTRPIIPCYFGVLDLAEGKRYMELEDLQYGMAHDQTTVIDIKIGFQTFQPDLKESHKPKQGYYDKAKLRYLDLLSAEEHARGKISKARWMSLNNKVSSTAGHGYRITGARIGADTVPLAPEKCTINVLRMLLMRSGISEESIRKLVTALSFIRDRLETSETFMTHHLYGASVLLVYDSKTCAAKAAVIDLAHLVPRGARLTDHRVQENQLPLDEDNVADGFLTGLENFIDFLSVYAAETARRQRQLNEDSNLKLDQQTFCLPANPQEIEAYRKIGEEESLLSDIFLKMKGVHNIKGEPYLCFEDPTYNMGIDETYTVMMIKLGFQTFDPLLSENLVPKHSYYEKAKARFKELITAEENQNCKMTKARWMHINNQISSTVTHGFRLDSARIGHEVLEITPENRTIETLQGAVMQAYPTPELLRQMAEQITNIRDRLEKSVLFKTHHLYGSMLKLVFNPKQEMAMKISQVGLLTARDSPVGNHRVAKAELPLPQLSLEDGYLSALDNLINLFSNLANETDVACSTERDSEEAIWHAEDNTHVSGLSGKLELEVWQQTNAMPKLDQSLGQVSGHDENFARYSKETVCKRYDEGEHGAYQKLVQEERLAGVLPRFLGLKEINDEQYMELEDLQYGMSLETTTVMDIKIGFQTFQPDKQGYNVPKEGYYAKAKVRYLELLSPAEHAMGKISKARWMSLNNQVSSTKEHGFRITGARIGSNTVTLTPEKCTINVLHMLLMRSGISEETIRKLVAALSFIRDRLETSETFMTHHLYGASVLLVYDSEAGAARASVIDLAHLVPRGQRLTDHRIEKNQLPVTAEHIGDGFLTGLENLIHFFQGEASQAVRRRPLCKPNSNHSIGRIISS